MLHKKEKQNDLVFFLLGNGWALSFAGLALES
jgi:hypothetical protein